MDVFEIEHIFFTYQSYMEAWTLLIYLYIIIC